ncbi:MAG: class I SAM-dependent RNA methyltransferase [Pseudomonadota bacterium]
MTDEVEIATLGAQGDGVTAAGVFVPRTLPGERVRLTPEEGDPARRTPAAILRPAPCRITPVCRHFEDCGGCTLQHADAPTVAAFKRDLVASALSAAGVTPGTVRQTLTIPAASRRRIALAARRTRSGVLIGFRGQRAETIVPITDCAVITPGLAAVLPRLAPLVEALASRKGTLRLTLTETEGGIDCAATGAKPLDPPKAQSAPRHRRAKRPGGAATFSPDAEALRRDLAAMAEALDLARLTVEDETLAARRPACLTLGPARVPLPPGAFLQPSAAGAMALTRLVQEALGPAAEGGPLVDLFAGVGTFALPLSAAAPVTAYELDAPAVDALTTAWRTAAPMAGLRRLEGVVRNLFRRPVLATELKGIAGAVIDPPFAGAAEQARALAESTVPRIASVSCNPATFARDAALLAAGGYVLDWVQPVDQFRWSAHVEVIGAFRRP